MFVFNNSRVVITGGAGSIGTRTAIAFIKQGADVILVDLREEKIKNTINKIKEETGIITNYYICNLSDIEATKELFYKLEDKFGQIDILVNNAGIDKDKLLMKISEDDLDTVMNINFKAPFFLSQAASIRMAKRNFGRIINISSVVAFTGNKGQTNYCASKSALLGMSKTIALEYAKRGITVNCIAPGAIKTPMIDVLSEEAKGSFLKRIPVGFFGSPDNVANTVIFLASKEAEYITGQTIHVNGGMFMF